MKGCFRPLSITDRHSLSQYDLSDVKIAMISLEILERGPVLCPVAEPQSDNSMCKLPETWASGWASLGLRSQVEKAGGVCEVSDLRNPVFGKRYQEIFQTNVSATSPGIHI